MKIELRDYYIEKLEENLALLEKNRKLKYLQVNPNINSEICKYYNAIENPDIDVLIALHIEIYQKLLYVNKVVSSECKPSILKEARLHDYAISYYNELFRG